MGKKKIIQKTEAELLKESAEMEAIVKKETKTEAPLKKSREGKVYISSSYNNTIMSLADMQGNVLAQVSAGAIGFKGAKKSTPFAASKVAEAVSQILYKLGIQELTIFVKGIGGGRESAIRSLAAKGFDIASVTDVTPIPHNGCRPKKVRRV